MPKRNNRNTTQRKGLSFIILLTITTYYAISSQMRRIGSTSVTNYHSSLSSFIQDYQDTNSNSNSESTFHNEKVWPKPYGWESYSYTLIRKHFSCHEYATNDKNKALPTLRNWHLFQSQYNKMVDETRSFNDAVPPTMGYTLTTNGTTKGGGGTSPLPPPYHAKHSTANNGHQHRGLFASRNIKKGELVHDGTHSNILFPDGMSWRKFIFSLPRNRACDMIDWTWAQKVDEEVASSSKSLGTGFNQSSLSRIQSKSKRRILSVINIFSLRNEVPAAKHINVIADSATSQKLYAARDITKEEEILMHYDVYTTRGVKRGVHLLKNYTSAYDTVWNEIGLGHMNIVRSSSRLSESHHNYYEPIWPKPNGWESFTLKKIKDHFECTAYIHDKNKPLPTGRDWELFRDAYQREVDDARTFDDVMPPTMGHTFGDNNDGEPPPYYLKREEAINKEPSLFASRNITKGELVHDGTYSNVMFPDASSWRRFIFALPRNRACDMMEWSWTQTFVDGGTLKFDIFAAIDISVFLGGTRVGSDTNVSREPPSSRYYATRDIGEDKAISTGILSMAYGALL